MTHITEEWKPVVGFEPWYIVSSFGRIVTTTKRNRWPAGLILKPDIDDGGYYIVWLNGGGRRKGRGVHCVVAEAFLGPRPEGLEVNHIDGVKSNNRLDNLEYVTKCENIQHSMRLGLRVPPQAKRKVTEDQVRDIRALKGRVTLREVSERYGIGKSQVFNIWNNISWKDVACATMASARGRKTTR